MPFRVLIAAASLALLGTATFASWQGWGLVSADTGPAAVAAGRSVRAGSAGLANQRRLRVK